MKLSHELKEAVFVLSENELLGILSEDVIQDMHAGDFSEETLKEAFVGIFASYGLTEDDSILVDEAIEEFVESQGLEEGFLERLKKASKDALKAVGKAALDAAKEGGKEAVATSAKELKKRIKDKEKKEPAEPPEPKGAEKEKPEKDSDEKPKKKASKKKAKEKEPEPKDDEEEEDDDDIKGKLKGIAGKALGKIAKDPGKTKEALKKGGKEAARALAKHGVKKGMKMVFGRWVKAKGGKGSKKEAIEWLSQNSEIHLVEDFIIYDFEGKSPEWVREVLEYKSCGGLDNCRYDFVAGDDVDSFMMSEALAYSSRGSYDVKPPMTPLIRPEKMLQKYTYKFNRRPEWAVDVYPDGTKIKTSIGFYKTKKEALALAWDIYAQYAAKVSALLPKDAPKKAKDTYRVFQSHTHDRMTYPGLNYETVE